MGKKLKKTLIVLLLALCSLFVFAACELGRTIEDELAEKNLTAQVTYYANGGRFEKNNQKKKTNFYYTAGSTAYDYGAQTLTGSAQIDRVDYEFMGWYFVDEVIDEENGLCTLGAKVDFSVPLKEGDHWLVAAQWRVVYRLQIALACDEGVTIKGTSNDEAVSYTNGSIIGEVEYDFTTGAVKNAPKEQFSVTNNTHTFYAYYDDIECTQETKFPVVRGEEERTIYAKYIEGDWTFVKTAANVRSMFSDLKGGSNKQFWIWNDIDCSKTTVDVIGEMNGEIKGNGYTLKGLTVSGSLSNKTTTFGLFGVIGETAKISDLTLENVSLNAKFTTAKFADVYFLFASKHEGATIENVNVSGKLTITGPKSCIINNMIKDDETVYTNCLYGGYATDEAYVTESQGKEFILTGEAEDLVSVELK